MAAVGLQMKSAKMLPFWQHFQSRSALVCVGEHPFGYESVLTRIPELPPRDGGSLRLGVRAARRPLTTVRANIHSSPPPAGTEELFG